MPEERKDAPRPDDMTAEGSSADDAYDPLEQPGTREGTEQEEEGATPHRTTAPPEADMYRDIQGDRVGG